MGRKPKSKKAKDSLSGPSDASEDGGWLHVDPGRVRFQHSKIRPCFSGCGRSVMDTLNEIRDGNSSPNDLPPIQVIIGPDENDGKGPWYFSLNNRRLWVLKRCKEEGLLENGKIKVRVRSAKSASESERYSLKNCALEAKFIREKKKLPGGSSECETTTSSGNHQNSADVSEGKQERNPEQSSTHKKSNSKGNQVTEIQDDDSDYEETASVKNPFGAYKSEDSTSTDEEAKVAPNNRFGVYDESDSDESV